MPASELVWSTFRQAPIFQVYGTKRKADEDMAAQPMHCDTETMQGLPGAKRHCVWTSSPTPQDAHSNPYHTQLAQLHDNISTRIADPVMETPDILLNNNNNNVFTNLPVAFPSNMAADSDMTDIHHSGSHVEQQHQYVHQAVTQVMSHQPPRVPSPWPSHHLPTPQAQQDTADRIMDLNDETYSSNMAANLPESESMDSDCSSHPQHNIAAPTCSDTSGSFCKNFCGAGDESPTSGLVRCYCKPSWEGMLDLKPYISDVY